MKSLQPQLLTFVARLPSRLIRLTSQLCVLLFLAGLAGCNRTPEPEATTYPPFKPVRSLAEQAPVVEPFVEKLTELQDPGLFLDEDLVLGVEIDGTYGYVANGDRTECGRLRNWAGGPTDNGPRWYPA